MILAERLCLFGFDPHSGRERDAPERDALKSAIAGLMLAALLSDTLLLKSPTCTDEDVAAGLEPGVVAHRGPEGCAEADEEPRGPPA